LIFTETTLKGAYVIESQKQEDSRGFFARTFCKQEFSKHGLNADVTQCSVSFNPREGTLRGMHFQVAPFEEVKLVRCTMGSIFDVIIDLRVGSATYKKWFGVELSARNHKTLYIPPNFAHGFETLVDDSEVFYQISQFYSAEHARGVRWNDPAFDVKWPFVPKIINERDRNYPDFRCDDRPS